MLRFEVIGLFTLMFCNVVSVASYRETWGNGHESNSSTEAERYWELVVEAKGGRKKLHSLENLVVSSDGQSSARSQGYSVHVEDLYVFTENRWWSWNNSTSSVFGLSMKMYDWKKGVQYSLTKGATSFTGVKPIDLEKSVSGFPGLIDVLIETRWDRPKPRKLIKSLGNITVETTLNGNRVDFVCDSKTMLPTKVVAYSASGKSTTRLSEYVDVKGIRFPSKVVFEGSDGDFEYVRSYDFNVKYNEKIFETPPPFALGRKAWKEGS